MKTVRQSLEKEFKCIADKCPATCCSGWQIMIDEESLQKYDEYNGPFINRISSGVSWEEECFTQKGNGDCAFLNEKGLCDLIIAEGERMLCDTCRLYPRHVEEYEGVREWSLSLSCPEVVRMLGKLDSFISFEVTEDDSTDPLIDEFEDFDTILFEKLEDASSAIYSIIENRKFSVETVIGLILEFAKQLQLLYDEGKDMQMDSVIEKFKSVTFLDELAKKSDFSLWSFTKEHFCVLSELEVLSVEWTKMLKVKLPENNPFVHIEEDGRDIFRRNILKSMIYTYFPGAVYNGMIYGYAGMCVFAVAVTEGIAAARRMWEKRNLTEDEYNEIIYRYFRETEHSDENINTLLEHFDL